LTDSAWAPVWDDVFAGHSWGKYPPEELVVFVSRTFGRVPVRSDISLLEVGCGPGANVWFMSREGFRVAGIDGSKIAVERAQQRLQSESLEADLHVGDMVSLPFGNDTFHGVIDVGSIQHNNASHRAQIVAEVRRVLAPGGHFFGIMLATGTWGEGSGRVVEPGS
jgi:SAM-dependent methyltransferase